MEKIKSFSSGPVILLLSSLFFIGVVFWGRFNETEIQVRYIDAGPVDRFAIGQVDQVDSLPLYVVGLENGTFRAIDTRLEGTECAAVWVPDDERGSQINYQRLPGVFEDPCSQKIWAGAGHAIGGDVPLRTPYLEPRPESDGKTHIFVEYIVIAGFPEGKDAGWRSE